MIGSGIALIVIAGIAYYSQNSNNLKEKSCPTGQNRCFGDSGFAPKQNTLALRRFEITYFRAAVSFRRCSRNQKGSGIMEDTAMSFRRNHSNGA